SHHDTRTPAPSNCVDRRRVGVSWRKPRSRKKRGHAGPRLTPNEAPQGSTKPPRAPASRRIARAAGGSERWSAAKRSGGAGRVASVRRGERGRVAGGTSSSGGGGTSEVASGEGGSSGRACEDVSSSIAARPTTSAA